MARWTIAWGSSILPPSFSRFKVFARSSSLPAAAVAPERLPPDVSLGRKIWAWLDCYQ